MQYTTETGLATIWGLPCSSISPPLSCRWCGGKQVDLRAPQQSATGLGRRSRTSAASAVGLGVLRDLGMVLINEHGELKDSPFLCNDMYYQQNQLSIKWVIFNSYVKLQCNANTGLITPFPEDQNSTLWSPP